MRHRPRRRTFAQPAAPRARRRCRWFAADAEGTAPAAGLREVSGADGGEIWNFAAVQETTQHLREAGFTDVDVRLVPDPARLERGEQLEAFIATVMLGAQLCEMSSEDRRPFVHEVAQSLPEPVIDYVRLQISAMRA